MKLIPENDPRLLQKSLALSKEDIVSEPIKTFSKQLWNVMVDSKGIGIAAVQVGELKRILCINTTFKAIMYNPVILKKQGSCLMEEGCLSFKDKKVLLTRAKKVFVKYLDSNARMKYVELDGIDARVFLHEFDHLEGKVFIPIL